MCQDEQTTVGQPALRSGCLGDTQGTKGDHTGTTSHKTWFSGGQWGRPMSNDGHSMAETELQTQMSISTTYSMLSYSKYVHSHNTKNIIDLFM